MSEAMRIGKLAKVLDVSTDTLRYYEKNGLLTEASRSESGYRLYGELDIARLRFILRAKAVGFSLSEIKSLLALQLEKDKKSCEDVKQFTEQKMRVLDQKIVELQRFHSALEKLHTSCCGGTEAATHCSILQALDASDALLES